MYLTRLAPRSLAIERQVVTTSRSLTLLCEGVPALSGARRRGWRCGEPQLVETCRAVSGCLEFPRAFSSSSLRLSTLPGGGVPAARTLRAGVPLRVLVLLL